MTSEFTSRSVVLNAAATTAGPVPQPPRCDPPPAGRVGIGDEKAAAAQSNIMGISLFLVCLCQLNNCNKSVWRGGRGAARAVRTHAQKYGGGRGGGGDEGE